MVEYWLRAAATATGRLSHRPKRDRAHRWPGPGRRGRSRYGRVVPTVGSGQAAPARLVPPSGFEPLISTLKGSCPRPLDDGGAARTAVYQGTGQDLSLIHISEPTRLGM